MNLPTLFRKCLAMPYIQVANHADYAWERMGGTLYIYFQDSNGATDWKNNLDFPAKPYRRMGKTVWLAHRGFLRVWKSLEEHLAPLIADPTIRKTVITGYSHGAAMAVFCHEYVWYHRPELRDTMEGYGFGCPRVVWGIVPPAVRRRWKKLKVIRNLNDLVTHVPPAAFGFSHVGQMVEIGACGKYSIIDAHRPENILAELPQPNTSFQFAHETVRTLP